MDIKDKDGKVVLIISEWVQPRKGVKADYPGHWFSLPDGEGGLIHSDQVVKGLMKFYQENF